MARVLFLLLLPALAAAVLPSDTDACNPDKMTVYKMVLHTYWTREKFPKHYPDWRPPAQWSKVYGKCGFFCLVLKILYTCVIFYRRYHWLMYADDRI